MAAPLFSPALDHPDHAADHVRTRGYAIVGPDGTARIAGVPRAPLEALAPTWDDLPPDLPEGRRPLSAAAPRQLRTRRRAGAGGASRPWQSVDYNALHGGMQRWFERLDRTAVASAAWSALLVGPGRAPDRLA